ncbi:MAG: hypothetical protein JST24_10105 [Acidobacteria bacterium]|nr:hypothetical protein [Acidobacteriota bacterium]
MDRGTSEPSIQLDLEAGAALPEPRRQRPIVESVPFERPKLEPAIQEGEIGSDQARQTVGFLMLIALVPELVGGLLGHGSVGFVGMGIPAVIAWGLLTGNDWICEYAFWSCILQVVLAPMLAFTLPHPALLVPSTLLRYGALALLLSDRVLSRKTYGLALTAIGLGTLLGFVASILR